MSEDARSGINRLPAWIYPVGIVGTLFVLVPVAGLVLRVSWPDFWGLVTSESAVDALRLSLVTASIAAVVALLFGVPLALLLARKSNALLRVVRAFVLIPLVLPPVVAGLALLYTFGRNGWIGMSLSFLGIEIAFSTTAVVIAQAYVSLPFVVLSLESNFKQTSVSMEEVAYAFGANPGFIFRKVVLPAVLPGLISAAILAFARALGEFGATLTFAGSMQGITRTLPLEIYLQREADPESAIALALLLMVVAFVTVLLTFSRSGARRDA